MAQLQSSSATALSVGGSAAWTTANSGASGGIDAGRISGYSAENLNIFSRLSFLDLRGGSYNLSTWYPMVITGSSTANGVTAIDIRRTSVHQDGSSYGAFFGSFRYRAGGYNFWEVNENWGSGIYYPFVANVAVATDNKSAVYLRGGLTYSYKFDNQDSLLDVTANSNKSFGSTTVSPTASVSLPSSAKLLQHSIASQGYNLGETTYGRWATVFTVSALNISSDRKFKEDIQNLTFGLNFIKKLKPKSYTLKPQPHWTEEVIANIDTRRHHGLIAQEVKQAMDELGLTDNDFAGFVGHDSKHWSLRYDQFIPVVVKAVQEQFDDLDLIEQRIARLEETV
jgi:hypothetical protein